MSYSRENIWQISVVHRHINNYKILLLSLYSMNYSQVVPGPASSTDILQKGVAAGKAFARYAQQRYYRNARSDGVLAIMITM